MGFWISYVATTAPKERLLSSLGLKVTGTSDEMPANDWWVATIKSTGWTILWSEDCEFVQANESKISKLSRHGDVLGCTIGEGANWSQVMSFCRDEDEWSLTWVGDKGVKELANLTLSKSCPEYVHEMKSQVLDAQGDRTDVDLIFDLPVNLASTKCGFRYDELLRPQAVDKFEIVEIAKPSTSISVGHRSWLARLFGMRKK